MTGTSPPAITSQTLREDGSYSTSVSIYDGMGQLRQVQQTPSDNEPGMLVTDTFYDTDGWVDKTSGPYYVSTASPGITTSPSTTMFMPRDDAVVPSQTVTTYDGQGRVTNAATWSDGAELWSTSTAYSGMDETDVTPPSGGTATTAITNILGQQTQSWQYTTATADGNSAHADVTAYTYYPSGNHKTVVDPDQNTTSYTYNLLGQETGVVSPDSGTTSYAYDNAGNQTSAATARGTVSYTYDSLNRKTAEYSGSTSGTELASWAYDTAAKGQPYSSTSYDGNGQAYTETVSGYNAAYEPTGSVTTIPSDAGSLASPSGGYTTTDTYTPLTGLLASTSYSGDGGLPAETVGQDYDLGGLPVSSGGAAAYVADTTYDAFGQVTRETLGSRPDQVARTYQLDPATNQVETVTTNLQTLGSSLFSSTSASDTTNYTYDDAGLVTSESDVQNSGGTELGCFTYNNLDQLTQAWTDTQGQDWTNANGSGATPVGAVQSAPDGAAGKCVTSTPSASTVGGPAPYWESYQYNGAGDRTSATMYNTAGISADNVTQTFGYPAAGTGNGTQPADAPQTVVTAGSAGSVSTAASYDGAGDESAEANTVTGTAPVQVPPGAQDVTYTPDGLIASVVLPGGGKATYQYDGSGTLIYQSDPKAGSVLYLDGGAEQLTESTGGTVTGYRFYSSPDGSTVVRTTSATAAGTGSGGGTVSYDLANLQGTATQEITVASGGGLAESRRYDDPYGNQVSAAVAWGDDKGFVGDPQDADTGLDLLGARAYDPVTGTFLSPDPEYQPGTVAEGGYAYADDDPATDADPTGLRTGGDGTPPNPCGVDASSSCNPTGGGGPNPAGSSGNDGSTGTGSGSTGSTPNSGSGSAAAGGGAPCTEVRFVGACQVSTPTGGGSLGPLIRSLFGNENFDENAIAFAMVIAEAFSCEDGDCVPPPDPEEGDEPAPGPQSAPGPCGNSFTSSTGVLLADGKTVPISSLKPGDKVLASDTKNGNDQAETVTAVLVRHDTDLYNLTVKTSHGTEVIHTTKNHLFWDPYPHYGWIPANHLKPGMHLKTPDGQSAVVVGGSTPAVHDGWMWDLTVPGNNDHDFYVMAAQGGDVPVLVHNSTCGVDPSLIQKLQESGVKFTPSDVVAAGENADGQVVFMETGNSRAGLTHIIEQHGGQFAQMGIPEEQVPDFVITAATEGKVVGVQGTRPIFEVEFEGQTRRVAVTVGSNGFVVGANPVGS